MSDQIKIQEKPVRPKKSNRKIGQEELTKAIMAFQSKGGLIHQLPAQVAVPRCAVGGGSDNGFETVVESL